MKILSLQQGTPEWLQHRANCRNASDAPAVMGASKKTKRSELVRIKATGDEKEYSRYVEEVIFANGHEVEAMARPIAEEIIGDELYPVIGTTDDGEYGASYDGLSMCTRIGWECKQWNKEKAEAVQNGKVPDEDYWQVIQQFMVSGAQKIIYMVTDGTRDNCVYVWVSYPAEAEIQKLIAGWKQFDEDVANYVHVEQKPEAVAASVEDLPAIFVQVSGALEIKDNFKIFEERLTHFLDVELVRSPQTDDDFATLDLQIKALKKAEEALAAAEQQMLAQVQTVDQAKRTKDALAKLVRENRLMAEKLLDAEKKARRNEIQMEGAEKMTAHIEQLNATFGGRIRMPAVPTDFVGAMKGKRTIASLRDAMETELARGKVAASMVADKIRLNLESLRSDAAGYEHLFADAQQLVLKENDDIKNVIALRIREHKDAEEKRLAAEREKIRAEEQAAAELRVQKEREEQERKRNEEQPAQAAAPTPVSIPDHSASATRQQPLSMPGSPAATQSKPAVVVGVPKRRPTDRQIIDALTTHFRVHDSKVIEWLMEMDLEAVSAELASSM